MFGLSTREKLTDLILNTSQNHVNIYASDVKELCDKENSLDEEAMEAEFCRIRNRYLDTVANSVFNFFNSASPKIYMRLQLLFVCPEKCGIDKEYFDLNTGMTAGKVYALCYYAMTNKTAKSYDCSKLSHLQNDIMQQALIKLSETM